MNIRNQSFILVPDVGPVADLSLINAAQKGPHRVRVYSPSDQPALRYAPQL